LEYVLEARQNGSFIVYGHNLFHAEPLSTL
jgi:hypothetical protein